MKASTRPRRSQVRKKGASSRASRAAWSGNASSLDQSLANTHLWSDYQLAPGVQGLLPGESQALRQLKDDFAAEITFLLQEYVDVVGPALGQFQRGGTASTTERLEQLQMAARKFFNVFRLCLQDRLAARRLRTLLSASASPLRASKAVSAFQATLEEIERQLEPLWRNEAARPAQSRKSPRQSPAWRLLARLLLPAIDRFDARVREYGGPAPRRASKSQTAGYLAELIAVVEPGISRGTIRNWLVKPHG